MQHLGSHVSTILGVVILVFGIPVGALMLALLTLIYAFVGSVGGVLAWVPMVSGVGVVFATIIYFRHRAPPRPEGVPGPTHTLPFVGNAHLYIANRFRQPDWFYEETCKHTKFARAWSWTIPYFKPFTSGHVVMLCTPENVRHVLKDNFSNYVKGKMFKETQREFLGQGIFNVDGPAWKMHRKIASHMFTRRLLTEGTKVAVREGRRLVRRLHAVAASGKEVDAQALFFQFTMAR